MLRRSLSSSAAARCDSSAEANTPSCSSASAISCSSRGISSSANATASSSCFSLIGFSRFTAGFSGSATTTGAIGNRNGYRYSIICNRSGYLLRATLLPPQIILVVPRIDMHPPVLHLEHPRRQPVDKVAVVRDEQHRAGKVRESLPAAHPSPAGPGGSSARPAAASSTATPASSPSHSGCARRRRARPAS